MKSRAQPCLVLSLQVPVQTSTLRAISSLLRGTQGEGALQKTVSNLAESTRHAQDWFEITLLWFFFVVLMYVTVKLAGESDECADSSCPLRRFIWLSTKEK